MIYISKHNDNFFDLIILLLLTQTQQLKQKTLFDLFCNKIITKLENLSRSKIQFAHSNRIYYQMKMKPQCKKATTTSLKIFKPHTSLSKMSFTQYDDQPTIMMQSNNRELNQYKNHQQNLQNQNSLLNTPKLTTYESNLIQSSPSRSLHTQTDGEFVCKYLTPIKKQQFERMLFKDEIVESPEKKTKPKYQSLKQNKKLIQSCKQTNILQNTNSNFNAHMKSCEMVQSFFPYETFNNNNQLSQCLKNLNLKLQKTCSCQINNNLNGNQHTGIFVDPYSQINFLKLNNHDLFAKLQKEIEKNNKLGEQIDKIRQQNKKLVSENTENQQKIKNLQKVLTKYETQRGNYLAKQWEQFNLVKEMLIQKKRSKSKTQFQKPQKQSKQQTLIDLSKVSILNVKNMDSASTIAANHTNNYKSSAALQVHTANYQFKTSSQVIREQKASCFQTKSRTIKLVKQDEKIERFLKDKLSIVMSSKDSQQTKSRNLQSCRTQNKQNFLNENRKRSKTSKSKKFIS